MDRCSAGNRGPVSVDAGLFQGATAEAGILSQAVSVITAPPAPSMQRIRNRVGPLPDAPDALVPQQRRLDIGARYHRRWQPCPSGVGRARVASLCA